MRTLALVIVLSSLSPSVHAQAVDARTKRLFRAKCASCHGEDGKGQTSEAKKLGGLRDLTDPAVQKLVDDAQLKEMITKGKSEKKDGRELKMPANPEIAGGHLDSLVKLVRGLAGPAQ